MSEIPNYFRYWGKADTEGHYHLLPYHCLDVAAVGHSLLDRNRPLCQRLAKGLGVNPTWLQSWFTFCLSLHDLGKFATAFQGRAVNLSDSLVPSNPRMPYTERHDTIGFLLWQDMLENCWIDEGGLGYESKHSGLRKLLRAFTPWLEIVTGHHGVPPKKREFTIRYQNFFTEQDERAAWFFCRKTAELFLAAHIPHS